MRGRPDIVIEEIVLGSSSILSGVREQSARPRLLSLRRSDVGKLLIADVDLRACRFVDSHNLDQLRLEHGCEFVRPPGRWRSQRAVIAEEHQLRARESTGSPKGSSLSKTNNRRPFQRIWRSGWYPDVCRPPQWFISDSPGLRTALSPSEIANIYRDLRKGRETGKDEPGANDFYYGEMEMRKLDDKRSRFERSIDFSYWLVSGYGLRASRALICLFLTVLGFGLLMYKWGLPDNPSFADALTFSAQSTTSLFHVPERNLTLVGSWLQIGLRLAGPLFLGLALLAIRGRVKR